MLHKHENTDLRIKGAEALERLSAGSSISSSTIRRMSMRALWNSHEYFTCLKGIRAAEGIRDDESADVGLRRDIAQLLMHSLSDASWVNATLITFLNLAQFDTRFKQPGDALFSAIISASHIENLGSLSVALSWLTEYFSDEANAPKEKAKLAFFIACKFGLPIERDMEAERDMDVENYVYRAYNLILPMWPHKIQFSTLTKKLRAVPDNT